MLNQEMGTSNNASNSSDEYNLNDDETEEYNARRQAILELLHQEMAEYELVAVLMSQYIIHYICKEPCRTSSRTREMWIQNDLDGMTVLKNSTATGSTSLGKRKIGETFARSKRSRKSTLQVIADSISRIAAASEGITAALDRIQRKETPPVTEVLPELCKIDAIACDPDFRRRCVNIMMHSMCRDMYAALKWSKEVLLDWLQEHAYNAPHLQIPPKC